MVLLATSELLGSVLCGILLATGKMFTPYLSFYVTFLLCLFRDLQHVELQLSVLFRHQWHC